MIDLPSNLYFIVTDNSIEGLGHKYTIVDGKASKSESLKNRLRLTNFTSANQLCFLNQIHGDKVYYVSSCEELGAEISADGFYTDKKGILLCVRTADCCPIILYSEDGKMIGGVHAGWKGAKLNIMRNLYLEMSQKAENISAIIGPTISMESYEVGKEFYDGFISENKDYKSFFTFSDDKYYFNLPDFANRKLEELGIKKIHRISEDTYSAKLSDGRYKYPSYRRHCHMQEDYPKSIVTGIMIKP